MHQSLMYIFEAFIVQRLQVPSALVMPDSMLSLMHHLVSPSSFDFARMHAVTVHRALF